VEAGSWESLEVDGSMLFGEKLQICSRTQNWKAAARKKGVWRKVIRKAMAPPPKKNRLEHHRSRRFNFYPIELGI
jgi:hypothetical protein